MNKIENESMNEALFFYEKQTKNNCKDMQRNSQTL